MFITTLLTFIYLFRAGHFLSQFTGCACTYSISPTHLCRLVPVFTHQITDLAHRHRCVSLLPVSHFHTSPDSLVMLCHVQYLVIFYLISSARLMVLDGRVLVRGFLFLLSYLRLVILQIAEMKQKVTVICLRHHKPYIRSQSVQQPFTTWQLFSHLLTHSLS